MSTMEAAAAAMAAAPAQSGQWQQEVVVHGAEVAAVFIKQAKCREN